MLLFDVESIRWILPGTFVAIHALARFNSPPTNRSLTTVGRYYTAAVAYVFATLFVYAMLGKSPDFVPFLFTAAGQPVPQGLRELPGPFLVALTLTVLLPRVPFLSDLDRKFVVILQDLAAIPYQALRLSKILRAAPFCVDPEHQEEVRRALEEGGFKGEDILFESSPAPQYSWTKVSILLYHLRRWEHSDRRLAAFRRQFAAEFKQFEGRYEKLSLKAKRFFQLIEPMASDTGYRRESRALRELRTVFEEEVGALLKSLYEFISRAMLRCRLKETSRNDELRAMGFQVGTRADPNMFERLVELFLLLAVYLMATMAKFGPTQYTFYTLQGESVPRQYTIEHKLLLGLMIAGVYLVSVVSALSFKRGTLSPTGNWSDRRVSVYLGAGLVAAACALAISLFWNLLLTRHMVAAFVLLRVTWPWCLMASLTASLTRFHLDTPSRNRIAWWEGLAQGTVTAVFVGVVYWLLGQVCATCHTLWLPKLMGNAFVVGFTIGFLVPNWYRNPATRPVREPDLDAALAAHCAGRAGGYRSSEA